ncbi:MAG: cyclase family protein [Candidatus Acidiferrales bacterium]
MHRSLSRIKIVLVCVALACGAAAIAKQSPSAASRPTPQMMNDSWLSGIASGQTRVVDLTYAIAAGLPSWPGSPATFEATVNATIAKDGHFARTFTLYEHYGTHMDAPAHFAEGKETLDQIPVNHLMGPAVVIDATADVTKNPDYQLPASSVERWEAAHGTIPAGAIVLLNTGWAKRWPDEARYRNVDASGTMHFPGYSADAAKLLVSRGVSGIGLDTLAVDYGPSTDHIVHHIVLGQNIFILENLADMSGLPESGAFVIAAPIKLEGGSGGAVRVFVILPQ